jgi:molybdopterin-guanine dinucleotide biosynthesis protein A
MQVDSSRNATAVVLAGGRSSRMGTSKAMLLFDGMPLVTHIVAMLRDRFADVVVVAAPDQQLPAMPATIVRDEVAYQGPVAGIYHGLKAAGNDVAFVTSCDSAFLNPRLIEHLVSSIRDHDVVVPWWQDRFQPLQAVYRTSVAPLLESQLARGELRPVFLFDKVRTRKVEEDEIRRFDPEGTSFFNMNTPADYDEALKRWGRGVDCTLELFGVARLLAHRREVALRLPPRATVADALSALADQVPALVGRVIKPNRRQLAEGCACNVNGIEFVRTPDALVNPGDRIIILSADAGG